MRATAVARDGDDRDDFRADGASYATSLSRWGVELSTSIQR